MNPPDKLSPTAATRHLLMRFPWVAIVCLVPGLCDMAASASAPLGGLAAGLLSHLSGVVAQAWAVYFVAQRLDTVLPAQRWPLQRAGLLAQWPRRWSLFRLGALIYVCSGAWMKPLAAAAWRSLGIASGPLSRGWASLGRPPGGGWQAGLRQAQLAMTRAGPAGWDWGQWGHHWGEVGNGPWASWLGMASGVLLVGFLLVLIPVLLGSWLYYKLYLLPCVLAGQRDGEAPLRLRDAAQRSWRLMTDQAWAWGELLLKLMGYNLGLAVALAALSLTLPGGTSWVSFFAVELTQVLMGPLIYFARAHYFLERCDYLDRSINKR